MKKILIVLDSFEYKSREKELSEYISDVCSPCFFYSKYENRVTEKFQKTKIVGKLLTHISYWILSFCYACKLLDKKYAEYDHVVCINPIVGIFYCLLSRILHINKKIHVGGFLFEFKRNKIYFALRKYFVITSYKNVESLFVYGKSEVEHYNSLFPYLSGKFQYVKYGRDYFYKIKKEFVHNCSYIAGEAVRELSMIK